MNASLCPLSEFDDASRKSNSPGCRCTRRTLHPVTTNRPRLSSHALHRSPEPDRLMCQTCSRVVYEERSRMRHSTAIPHHRQKCSMRLCARRFRQSTYEVCQMHMPTLVQEHVVWLHIPMDDPLRVDVLDGASQFGDPESYRVLGKGLSGDVEAKVTAIHEIHHNVAGSAVVRPSAVGCLERDLAPVGRFEGGFGTYRYSMSWKLYRKLHRNG